MHYKKYFHFFLFFSILGGDVYAGEAYVSVFQVGTTPCNDKGLLVVENDIVYAQFFSSKQQQKQKFIVPSIIVQELREQSKEVPKCIVEFIDKVNNKPRIQKCEIKVKIKNEEIETYWNNIFKRPYVYNEAIKLQFFAQKPVTKNIAKSKFFINESTNQNDENVIEITIHCCYKDKQYALQLETEEKKRFSALICKNINEDKISFLWTVKIFYFSMEDDFYELRLESDKPYELIKKCYDKTKDPYDFKIYS